MSVLRFYDKKIKVVYECANGSCWQPPSLCNKAHSTWQEAVKVAKQAQVQQLILFHHDPSHTDLFMDDIARQAQTQFPATAIAQEDMVITLEPDVIGT